MSFRRYPDDRGLILLLAFVGFLILAAVAYEWRYPCVRTEPGMCSGVPICVAYDTDSICTVWLDQPDYPCDVCVERAP